MINYIKKEQPIFYKTIKNTKASNTFPQAILLSGSQGLPLLEIAKFAAASIICEGETACLECLSCLRIENHSYSDLIVIDGKYDSITKPNIQLLQERFSKSALEKEGKKIYIINHIENSTKHAVNGLLKFLEEPDKSLFAILTTSNISDVLPTVVSRCLTIRLKNVSQEELIKKAIKNNIPIEDANILTSFVANEDEILSYYNDEKYFKIKNGVISVMKKFNTKEDLLYFASIDINDIIINKVDFELLINILEVFYNDLINIKNDKNLSFENYNDLILKLSKKIKNIEKSLETILLIRGRLSYNVNIKLLLDNLFIRLGDDIDG